MQKIYTYVILLDFVKTKIILPQSTLQEISEILPIIYDSILKYNIL